MGDKSALRNSPYQASASDFEPKQSLFRHPATLALLVAIIGLLFYASYRFSGEDDLVTDTSGEITTSSGDDGDTTDDYSAAATDGNAAQIQTNGEGGEAATDDRTDPAAPDTDADADADDSRSPNRIPAPDGPYVAARLDLESPPGQGMFTLSGRVPDDDIAAQLRRAAELSYGPFVESELEVDPSLEPAPWLAAAPGVIGLLPGIVDGTIMVTEGKILFSARSSDPTYLQVLQGGMALLTGGMSVEMVDTVITGQTSPRLTVQANSETIRIGGAVPSEQVAGRLAGAAALTYGEQNVVNELRIDPSSHEAFWMHIMPGALQLLKVYPQYNFSVENGRFFGKIVGGLHFDLGSDGITPETARALNVAVGILARDPTIGMTVVGHTDAQGSDEYNAELSLTRAQAVVGYFSEAGIDAVRLVAKGAGESEPIADNETEEGRAANRRVEFIFGPITDLER